MELREKLLALKTENGLTTDALSERSGVPKGTINKLLNGETRNPTTQTLRRLAKALNCPLETLCGQPTDIPGVYRLGALTGDAQALMARGELTPVHRRRVPLLGKIAAGKPILCEEEVEVVGCDDHLQCDFALKVSGDSMVGARIHDGDIVFIRSQEDVDDGQIAAVIIDDRATLKRVYHIPNGVQLLSENPKYPPMVFTYPEHECIRILGRAVGFQSRL